MLEIIISGVPVKFPFQPYQVQLNYMEKVIECLENGTNGILESPTGTGKTLSLLCSSLGWLLQKKIQFQANRLTTMNEVPSQKNEIIHNLNKIENRSAENDKDQVPTIIYASRTHSQLTQAIQELKNSGYKHVKATVLGSRDQLCINPDVTKEINNNSKVTMCKLKVFNRTCSYYHNVEKKKDHPDFSNAQVMDIEDIVKTGQKHRACPYFMSKELTHNAEIIFMPYNYLLDPKARRANKIELANTIIILDEAHNVEKMCEESASVQIKSSEIALCIDDVTAIMKSMEYDASNGSETAESAKDFTIDDLTLLKEMFLNLEIAIDEIVIHNPMEGITFQGTYMFELLRKANVTTSNHIIVEKLLSDLILWLSQASEKKQFIPKGTGLQTLFDLISIAFAVDSNNLDKVEKCFKVHIDPEEAKATKTNKLVDGWTKKNKAKILSYWCFSPTFGMNELVSKNIRSIILTSGTLAPLKPLISELGIPVPVHLENPHIVGKSQVFVKIVGQGPDKELLNSNFQNRDNPRYVASLGRTILSLCPVIPHGMLVFFPSYPVLSKCQNAWQASGIWSQICQIKPIFVEPRTKDAFIKTMNDYYANINDPVIRGAIFMAVCRGKVSEGLDFADINGRAVLITGLPFPPLKDPRVILKKRYLQENRNKENELLTGDEWYVLEASRAVNQAIGRVIRHKDDYGAILLCDVRFNNPRQKSQLSSWIQGHLNSTEQMTNFGPLIRDVSKFFRNAEKTLPQPGLKSLLNEHFVDKKVNYIKQENPETSLLDTNQNLKYIQNAINEEKINDTFNWSTIDYINHAIVDVKPKDFLSGLDKEVNAIDFNDINSYKSPQTLVTIHKRSRLNEIENKKKKFKLISNNDNCCSSLQLGSLSKDTQIADKIIPNNRTDLLKLIKESLSTESYKRFLYALTSYHRDNNFNKMYEVLLQIFHDPDLFYIFKGK